MYDFFKDLGSRVNGMSNGQCDPAVWQSFHQSPSFDARQSAHVVSVYGQQLVTGVHKARLLCAATCTGTKSNKKIKTFGTTEYLHTQLVNEKFSFLV